MSSNYIGKGFWAIGLAPSILYRNVQSSHWEKLASQITRIVISYVDLDFKQVTIFSYGSALAVSERLLHTYDIRT